eukprot:SAG31_NODE_7589_length_1646_cov_1.303167_2_plen_273_part_00
MACVAFLCCSVFAVYCSQGRNELDPAAISRATRDVKMAVADLFALAKTTSIVAQPVSTFSLVAAWIANIPYANLNTSYPSQSTQCESTPHGRWGRSDGLQYPVRCWLPLADGEIAEDDLDEQESVEVYDETEAPNDDEALPGADSSKAPLAADSPPIPFKDAIKSGKEYDLCISKGGILTMRSNQETGICCPAECGPLCGRAGCAQGAGGYRACCAGKIRRSANMCHNLTGNLVADGCLMQRASSWVNSGLGLKMASQKSILTPKVSTAQPE